MIFKTQQSALTRR